VPTNFDLKGITNSFPSYLGYILKVYLNYSQTVSLVLACVAFTQCAIVSTPPYFFIDRIGRRRTLIFSSASSAVYLAIISGSLLDETYSGAGAAVAFMFLYLDCYVLGFLPASWSYSAEIQPRRVRNKATAVGVFTHWVIISPFSPTVSITVVYEVHLTRSSDKQFRHRNDYAYWN
jgi:MFS family permease